jgi:hypothetical protein
MRKTTFTEEQIVQKLRLAVVGTRGAGLYYKLGGSEQRLDRANVGDARKAARGDESAAAER